jgi:hypothetical protein
MMDNLFVNNALCRALNALINFCNEQNVFSSKKLKFSQNVPLNNIAQNRGYKTRFIFSNPSGAKQD